ncbi:MAG: archease [Actinobacteria bacterium]|nr:archease [Actinomycetota bacterium]
MSTSEPRRFDPGSRALVYRELDHPADLWLEVRGVDLPNLVENALFALYDSMVALERVEERREVTLHASGASAAEALRTLLAEALFLFATEGFVGVAAQVHRLDSSTEPGSGDVRFQARVRGERLDTTRHETRAEVKAVTYHLLDVTREASGAFKAFVLLDV